MCSLKVTGSVTLNVKRSVKHRDHNKTVCDICIENKSENEDLYRVDRPN